MYIKLSEGMKMPPRIKDYGPPKLSKDFFDKNQVKELSAQRFLYSQLLYPGMRHLLSLGLR